jgi:hypothetical protein
LQRRRRLDCGAVPIDARERKGIGAAKDPSASDTTRERSDMGTLDALDKAKKVADQAAVTAAGILDRTVSKAQEASDLASDVRGQAAAKVDELKDALAGKIAEVKDAAFASVQQIAKDLNGYLPALGEAGYTLHEVSAEIGIVPKIDACFIARPDITQERIDAVIAQHADSKVLAVILRALYGAYKLQNSIDVAGMKPHGIMLTLGVTPSVAVKFH